MYSMGCWERLTLEVLNYLNNQSKNLINSVIITFTQNAERKSEFTANDGLKNSNLIH